MTNIINMFLSLDYFTIIIILSVVLTVITTFVYKWVTDQDKLKKAKKEIKDMQAEMKKHKHDQKKMLKIQQEMMSKNTVIMKQSFKPMLYTIIPMLLVLGWMTSTLAYEPLMPGQSFTVQAILDNAYIGSLDEIKLLSIPEENVKIVRDESYVAEGKKIQWLVQMENEGKYSLVFEGEAFKESKDILITTSKQYEQPTQDYSGALKKVIVGNKEVKTPLFGLNWLWTYIIISVVFSMILRKVLNIA